MQHKFNTHRNIYRYVMKISVIKKISVDII